MCGRYVSATPAQQLAEEFGVDEVKAELPARFNVAPTLDVYAVAPSKSAGHRQLGTFRWGLVPSWATDPSVGNRMINARAETLATKPAFKRILARRRCIIPADGFYEWQRQGDAVTGPRGGAGKVPKQPFFIRRTDGRSLAFAGLWDVWKPKDQPDADWLRSCTIITGPPNELLARIHDRMPVILADGAWDMWLDPDVDDIDALESLLAPYPAVGMQAYPVSKEVNNVGNDGPGLAEPLDGHAPVAG